MADMGFLLLLSESPCRAHGSVHGYAWCTASRTLQGFICGSHVYAGFHGRSCAAARCRVHVAADDVADVGRV